MKGLEGQFNHGSLERVSDAKTLANACQGLELRLLQVVQFPVACGGGGALDKVMKP